MTGKPHDYQGGRAELPRPAAESARGAAVRDFPAEDLGRRVLVRRALWLGIAGDLAALGLAATKCGDIKQMFENAVDRQEVMYGPSASISAWWEYPNPNHRQLRVSGTVVDARTGNPIPWVRVSLSSDAPPQPRWATTTSLDGTWSITASEFPGGDNVLPQWHAVAFPPEGTAGGGAYWLVSHALRPLRAAASDTSVSDVFVEADIRIEMWPVAPSR